MKNLTIIFLALFLLIGIKLSAQHDLTLYHMPVIPQVTTVNPAFIPKSRVNIGLPVLSSIYFSTSNTGFKYNDIIKKREDDSLVLTMGDLIENLEGRNFFTTSLQTDLLSIGINVKGHYFSFNATEKIYNRIIYPKDLVKLIWEGNGKSLLGQRADLDGSAFDFMHYREFGLGYAKEIIEDKLTIGLKAKYLYGMENINTKTFKLGLTTDANSFDLMLDGGLELQTSGIDKFSDAENELTPGHYLFGAKNRGFGIDLGASYKYNEKFSFSASILDLGFITWKDDVRNYVQKDFNFVYKGLYLDDVMAYKTDDTEIKNMMDATIDSFANTINVQENSDPYTTMLAARVIVGGTYSFSERHDAGLIIFNEFAKGRSRIGFSVSYNTHFWRWLSASVNYSVYNRNFFNVGAGLAVNAGPVQIYFLSDNVASVFIPHMTQNVHFRTGLNLTFGRKPKES